MSDKTYDLYINSLGKFCVENSSGESISTQQRSSKKWLLFQLLFTFRNDNLSLDKIYDYINLNESVNPAEALKVLVYNLRQSLNDGGFDASPGDYIICEKGLYYFNNDSNYWFDGEEIEKLYNRGKSLRAEDPQTSLELYHRAVDLYRGDYLMEIDAEAWVLPTRNYYRKIYLSLIISTCNLLIAREDYNSAINLCLEGLKINPYEEQLHEIIIKSYCKTDQFNLARIHYEDMSNLYQKNNLTLSNKLAGLKSHLYINSKSKVNPIIELTKHPFVTELEGAIVCDIEIFKLIYKFEKAKQERRKGEPFLVYFKLPKETKNEDSKIFTSNEVEELFKKQLRKSDLFCPWNGRNYVLLLNGYNSDAVENVIERLENSLRENYGIPEDDIEIRVAK